MTAPAHIPVLLAEVLDGLQVGPGQCIVDGTLGGGGYAVAMLERGARVEAFDRDPRAIAGAEAIARRFPGLSLHHDTFAHMADYLEEGVADGVALDLGYSSIQMDDPAYGLSFQTDGPLDMRLSGTGPSAADFINHADEAVIADVLFRYGEEPAARRIARAIVADRPFHTTGALAALIRRVARGRPDHKRDPATRSFQALRIQVNDEFTELERGLAAAERVLKPGGRLAVVSFHSLEDRIVKHFMAERSGSLGSGSRHRPAAVSRLPSFERPERARRPAEREVMANPRARSAILRVARRSRAPGWDTEKRGAGPATNRSAGTVNNSTESRSWHG